jgi:hypothetical protein
MAGLIALEGKLPPIHLPTLIEWAPISQEQTNRMKELVESKRAGTEMMLAQELPEFDEWLADFINSRIPEMQKKFVNLQPYREMVIEMITGVSK